MPLAFVHILLSSVRPFALKGKTKLIEDGLKHVPGKIANEV